MVLHTGRQQSSQPLLWETISFLQVSFYCEFVFHFLNVTWIILLLPGLSDIPNFTLVTMAYIYRVSHELRSLLRDSVPYVKIYRYNPKHLCPKLNGYGDNGQRRVLTSCISAYCTSSAVSALTLTEQCSRPLCECTSSAQRDKIVLH